MHLCNCSARIHVDADRKDLEPDRKVALKVLRAWFGPPDAAFMGDSTLANNIVNAAMGGDGWWTKEKE